MKRILTAALVLCLCAPVFGQRDFGPGLPLGANVITVQTSTQLTAALARATSGQTVMLAPGTYTTSGATFNLPSGVSLVSSGGPTATILAHQDLAAASLTYAVLTLRGSNHVEGIRILSRGTAAGTEGAVMVTGANHLIVNCRWTGPDGVVGNQDLLQFGFSGASTDADKWAGPTELRSCELNDWRANCDVLRFNTFVTTGARRLIVSDTRIEDTRMAQGGSLALIYNGHPLDTEFRNCVFRIPSSTNANSGQLLQRGGITTYNARIAFTGADWAVANSRITKAGAFSAAVWRPGDRVVITAGGTAGTYGVAAITADALTVVPPISGVDLTGTVEGYYLPVYRTRFIGCTMEFPGKFDSGNDSMIRFTPAIGTPAGMGMEVSLDNCVLKLVPGARIALGNANANMVPAHKLTLIDTQITGYTLSGMGGTNEPELDLRGTSRVYQTAPTAGATVTINVRHGNSAKWTAAQDETVNLTGTQYAGEDLTLLITDDDDGGDVARVITFGTGFKSTGTLTGTEAKMATVRFVSDGTNMHEVGRAVGITP